MRARILLPHTHFVSLNEDIIMQSGACAYVCVCVCVCQSTFLSESKSQFAFTDDIKQVPAPNMYHTGLAFVVDRSIHITHAS